ncbi:hypothetical protein RI129_013251 [Pyrocoelia pectoralis]|uniref:Ketosynthase family 3 (KS3) domain-containing protein n=1 Tax=Pyrocoelia pectoralis TaxID=417401 RepID=A0AAN7V5M5_9COLE
MVYEYKTGTTLAHPPPGEEIVITGMAGSFPESNNISEYTKNIYNKVDMVTADNRRWLPTNPEIPHRSGKLNFIEKSDAGYFAIAQQIGHHFNFNGPTCVVDSASSSSLYAFEEAYRALREDRCESAIVAGGSMCLNSIITLHFWRGGVLAADGSCKVFDERANGYVRSEANVVVHLQKRRNARRIYAQVLTPLARINYKYPLSRLYDCSIVRGSTRSTRYRYVCTLNSSLFRSCLGTRIGDEEETAAIDAVFCQNRKEPLSIGSVKSYIGHTEGTSFLASLVKVLVGMENNHILPNINFNTPSRYIDGLIKGRLMVPVEIIPWPEKGSGLAAINSFGFGGLNAHVVLKRFCKEKSVEELLHDGLPRLMCVSGRSDECVQIIFNDIENREIDIEYCRLIQQVFKVSSMLPGEEVALEHLVAEGQFQSTAQLVLVNLTVQLSLVDLFKKVNCPISCSTGRSVGSLAAAYANGVLSIEQAVSAVHRDNDTIKIHQIPGRGARDREHSRDVISITFGSVKHGSHCFRQLNVSSINTVHSLLSVLGNAYMMGFPICPELMYPPINWPVSRGTPMISPIIKWNHGMDWFYTKEAVPPQIERKITVLAKDTELSCVYLDTTLCTYLVFIPLQVRNMNELVVSGSIFTTSHRECTLHTPVTDVTNGYFSSEDIYKELHLRGYNYSKVSILRTTEALKSKCLSNESQCAVIFLREASMNLHLLSDANRALMVDGVVISRENPNFNSLSSEDFVIASVLKTEKETLVLLTKASHFFEYKIITTNLNGSKFDWMEEVQGAVKNEENVLLVVQNEPLSGVLGFTNCLRRELGGAKFKCVFIMDEDARFNVADAFFSQQMQRGLAINILKDGVWGTYRHLLLEDQKEVERQHIFNDLLIPGDYSSLRWVEGPLSLESEKAIVRVFSAGINFKDVIAASGKITEDGFTKQRLQQSTAQGMEFIGKDLRGRRVMGIVPHGALSTLVEADLARIVHGERILIHSGSGGVGQAAINLALRYKCDIFTTVGSEEKSHIGNSRDCTFEQMVLKYTKGRGVNIVLNSLSEQKLEASLRCLARNGRFIEIGKYDLVNNKYISLSYLGGGRRYCGAMLNVFLHDHPSVKVNLWNIVHNALEKGMIKPLRWASYTRDDIEHIYRKMAVGKHIGKFIVQIREELQHPPKVFKGLPRYGIFILVRFPYDIVIVGGLGGFGLELVDWMVLKGGRKFLLISRSGIKNGYGASRIRLWKSYGANIHVVTDDISNPEICDHILRNAEKLGPVAGIFNLALVLHDALFENQTEESFIEALTPKATITHNLDKLSRKLCPSLKYFVVFSSLSCGRGNVGQTNYGMGNSIAERICEKRKKEGFPGLAIQWAIIGDVFNLLSNVRLLQTTMSAEKEAGIALAHPLPGEEIVITGMAGRFPESDNVYEFRKNIYNKTDMITSDNRRWLPGNPEIPHRTGKISYIDKCDAGYFGMSHNEVNHMDPIIRILLERSCEALLDSGYNIHELANSKIGVFIGSCFSESEQVMATMDKHVENCSMIGNRMTMANRVSHHFQFCGPSVLIDTACSSSMYALESAYRAIRVGKCEAALVGGVGLCLSGQTSVQFARLGVLSMDGICRAFDENANGYVRSEAIAVVFLQKMKNSRRIYAQVVHSKTNCDGYKEQGVTFPSSLMQGELLKETYADCQLDPVVVDVLEAHATGTPVGDPEEMNACDSVFCINRPSPLIIGSVKSYVGHTEAASGMCSLVKALIQLEDNTVLPNSNFKTPRQCIKGLIEGRMMVPVDTIPWPQNGSGIVGVCNYGFGGANVHVILKGMAKEKINDGLPEDNLPRLICVSGRTKECLKNICDDISGRKLDAEYCRLIQQIFKYENFLLSTCNMCQLLCLNSIYMMGYTMSTEMLYPQIKWPVSKGTPMISPLISWNYDNNWFTILEIEKERRSKVSLVTLKNKEIDWSFLPGHIIDGKLLTNCYNLSTRPMIFTRNYVCVAIIIRKSVPAQFISTNVFALRGAFRALEKANLSGTVAWIKWEGNWVTFIDNLLQSSILNVDTRNLYVPTFIERLVIDAPKHVNEVRDATLSPIHNHHEAKILSSGGIEVRGFRATAISRRRTQKPILETYKFVPFHTELQKTSAIRVCMQLLLENNFLTRVKVVEVIERKGGENALMPIIKKALDHQPHIKYEFTIMGNENVTVPDMIVTNGHGRLSMESLCDVVVLEDASSLNDAIGALKENGFVILRDGMEHTPPDFDVISTLKTETEVLTILKKTSDFSRHKIVQLRLNGHDFDWMREVKEAIKNDEKVLMVVQQEPLSGVLGFINCLRREPGGMHFKCVFIMDPDVIFNRDDQLFAKQLKKCLAINVLRGGVWGTYRHLELESEIKVERPHIFNSLRVTGNLSSLTWVEGPLREDVVELERFMVSWQHGEGNQMTSLCRGRRVMGIVPFGSLSTLLLADNSMVWEIPVDWSMEQGASVPITYSTALYGLCQLAKMKRGESILIHAGAGGIGQTAINLALSYECDIFITVGTEAKKQFIKEAFPQIPDNHIGNSRNCSFEQMVLKQTRGRGVDIIINSLSEEKLQASLRCLARNGRFVEIGKYDLLNNNKFAATLLSKGCTYFGTMLDLFFSSHPHVKRLLQKIVQNGLDNRIIKPLHYQIYKPGEVEKAYRDMAAGKHIGKIIVQIRQEDQLSPTLSKAMPRFFCNPLMTYIVIGGLGGLGLELVDWMILRGARKLVLVSRNGVRNGYAASRIKLWKNYQTSINVSTEDVSSEEGCIALLKNASKLAPIAGIFNLALTLKDGLFENLTEEAFRTTLLPKSVATFHLDVFSRRFCPNLKYFVMFSTASCGRGNVGQSNYGMANSIMERMCEKRKMEGLPALAIQWGPMGEVRSISITDLKTVSEHTPLPELGMDSMTAIEIKQTLERECDVFLNATEIRTLTFAKLKETLSRKSDQDGVHQNTTSPIHTLFQFLGNEEEASIPIKTLHSAVGECEDARTVLVLPGFEGTSNALEPLANKLSAHVKCVQYVYDQYDYSIRSLAKSILPLIPAEQTHFNLIAYSYGCIVALELVAMLESEGKLGNIVLIDGSLEMFKDVVLAGFADMASPPLMETFTLSNLMSLYMPLEKADSYKVMFVQYHIFQYSCFQEILLKLNSLEERVNFVLDLLPNDAHYSKEYRKKIYTGFCLRMTSVFNYKPNISKLKSSFTLFKSKEGVPKSYDEDYKLQRYCEKTITVKVVDGSHVSVIKNANLASAINDIINNNKHL